MQSALSIREDEVSVGDTTNEFLDRQLPLNARLPGR